MGPQHGSFCWNELNTRDAAAAKPFYAELFGWKFKESKDGMPYTEIGLSDDRPFGGIFQLPDEMANIPPFWMAYVAVDDVDASAKKVAELGGKIHKEPADIPGVGRFCIIADPTGAVMALITINMSPDHKS
ncbi:MAG TPA: VOC family protein [Pyrinomonadaceae bacterium]|jgi:predicted enzyme related to lactoylglutathione lyase|nr:VOC family protein [Pyrinomonadaceae bacterium]